MKVNMIAKVYVYFLYSTIYAVNIFISSQKLEYMNPLKWNDSVKMFIYQHENFCSNKDISYELSDAGETQQYDDIPVFSPCNLSKRDILNIYKIAQVEDMDGEPNVTLSGCTWPNEEEFKIVINKTVKCRDRIKGKCLLHFNNVNKEFLVLPGTEIQYQCEPDFFFFDPSNETAKIATCKDNLWLPQIETCRNKKDPHKYEMKWDEPIIWKPDLFIPGCGMSAKKSASNDSSRVPVTSAKEFPWHVAVYYDESEIKHCPICGASIISSRFLISAAHCFVKAFEKDTENSDRFSDFYIMAGKINARNDAKESHKNKIKHVFTYDYFGNDLNHQNDIAIIWTEEVIVYEEHVSPICLINDYFPYIPKDEVPLMTAVWGSCSEGIESLMSATTWFHSYQECMDEDTEGYLSPEKFCMKTKSGVKNLRKGDSGSGLVMKGPNDVYYLIGIVHYGWSNSKLTLGTYVPQFHHWILETIYSTELHDRLSN